MPVEGAVEGKLVAKQLVGLGAAKLAVAELVMWGANLAVKLAAQVGVKLAEK